LRITFLGTGTSVGIPMIGCSCAVCNSQDKRDKRLRSSILIETQGKTLVVDTGPDFRQQMLRANVGILDAVLFTHEHKDHLAGLDEVRAYNFLLRRNMPVYASERVQQAIRREYSYIFETPDYPGIPRIDFTTIDDNEFQIDTISVRPIQVMHHLLPVLGFRIGDFIYITDANFISDAEKEKIRGSKVLVINALRREPHISHFALDEALALVREVKPQTAYFTHISHQLGKHENVQNELPSGVFLAYDELTITI
jgi:phosphoribosyl 1,2-cyclic phosphate phosphodiesterase